jgi:hypothetical protein
LTAAVFHGRCQHCNSEEGFNLVGASFVCRACRMHVALLFVIPEPVRGREIDVPERNTGPTTKPMPYTYPYAPVATYIGRTG